jgi:hypothetical protein
MITSRQAAGDSPHPAGDSPLPGRSLTCYTRLDRDIGCCISYTYTPPTVTICRQLTCCPRCARPTCWTPTVHTGLIAIPDAITARSWGEGKGQRETQSSHYADHSEEEQQKNRMRVLLPGMFAAACL